MFWNKKKPSQDADNKDLIQVFNRLFSDIEGNTGRIENIFSMSFGMSPTSFMRNITAAGDAIHGLRTAVAAANEPLPYLTIKEPTK